MTDAAKPPSPKRSLPPLDVEGLLFAHADPVCVLDAQGRLLAANPPALQFFNMAAAADWQGVPLTQFFTAEAQNTWADHLREVLATRSEVHTRFKVNGRSDPANTVELAIRPVLRGRRIAALQVVMRPIARTLPDRPGPASTSDVFQRITTAINSKLDVLSVVQAIVEQLGQLVTYDRAVLLLHEQGHFEVTITRGYNDLTRRCLVEAANTLWTLQTIVTQTLTGSA